MGVAVLRAPTCSRLNSSPSTKAPTHDALDVLRGVVSGEFGAEGVSVPEARRLMTGKLGQVGEAGGLVAGQLREDFGFAGVAHQNVREMITPRKNRICKTSSTWAVRTARTLLLSLVTFSSMKVTMLSAALR